MNTKSWLQVAHAALLITAAAPSLAQQSTTAAPSEGLEEVTVLGKIDFFKPEDSTSAAKMALSVIETPQSVSVLTSDLLETFQVRDVRDVAKFVAGLDNHSEGIGEFSATSSRGFNLDVFDGYKLNGISYYPAVPLDPVVLERVEVLKGPSGVVYGRNSYGGAINYITRQPTAEGYAAITAQLGTTGLRRLEADVSGRLGDGSIGVRVPMAVEREDYLMHRDRTMIAAAPSIVWDVSDATRVTLFGVLQQWSENLYLGFGRVAANLAQLPEFDPEDPFGSAILFDCTDLACGAPPKSWRGYSTEPGWNSYDSKSHQAALTVRHRLSDFQEVVISATQYQASLEARQGFILGISAMNGDTPFWGDRVAFDQDGYSLEAAWTGDFEWLGGRHTFYVGADYRQFHKVNQDTDDPLLGVLNVYNQRPATGVGIASFAEPNWVVRGKLDDERRYAGIGIQALLRLGERWSLLLGGRYESARLVNEDSAYGTPEYFESIGVFPLDERRDVLDTNRFIPRAGLTWWAVPERWNLYASYSQGYVPQIGVTRGGGGISSEEGGQIEFGTKAELFDRRLLVSFAAYEIQRTNVARADPMNVPPEAFVIGGLEQRSRGVELEVVGKPLPGLSVLLEISHIVAEYLKDVEGSFAAGTRVAGVPRQSGSLFATYEFRGGRLDGLSVGGGVSYVGRQLAAPDSFDLPDFTTVDLQAQYAASPNLKFGLVVENVFDEVGYTTFGFTDDFGLLFIPGRTARISATYTLK